MGALAPWHWAVLIIVVFLIFGSRHLPEAGTVFLGQSITGVKRGPQQGTE